MPTLVIANKRYSSWSLRPWLLARQLGVPFEEELIPLGRPDTAARIRAHAPATTVPIWIDGVAVVWESLAIMDHLADGDPGLPVWPAEPAARAFARSISAEMHAGFRALRAACPMNLGRRYAGRDRGEAVARDVERITALWREARGRFGEAAEGGRFLFGAFSAADAMFAPVATRLDTYGFALDPDARDYVSAILGLPAFQEWREAALDEPWIVAADEVDEEPLEDLMRAR